MLLDSALCFFYLCIYVKKQYLCKGSCKKHMTMYTIRKAEITDLPQLEQIYAVAREKMRAAGNPNQWGNNYPSTELMTKDIRLGCNYLVLDNGDIVGTFVMLTTPDPSYKQIDGAWLNNEPYATIHRLASLDGYHSIFAAVLDYVSSRYDNVRADTHQDNLRMQHLLLKHGFRYCGNILLSGRLPKELQPVQEDIQADNPLFRLAYQLSK